MLAVAALWPALAVESTAVPNFAPSSSTGWLAASTEFTPPPNGPHPVSSDPAHPYVPNVTFRVADLNNPILQPWAKEELKKVNERVMSGKPVYTRVVACWPLGVPGFLLYVAQPVYFIQTRAEVWMIYQSDHQVRRIYLNRRHSARPALSWFGESIGRYEGDTLVVDTVGLNEKTYVDNYRTPHTDRLHVIERFHLIEGGKTLEVNVRVEDPGAFTTPWNAIQRYRRAEQEPLTESTCAENNANYFNQEVEPIPQADKPDF
jgi:hypothetical protein